MAARKNPPAPKPEENSQAEPVVEETSVAQASEPAEQVGESTPEPEVTQAETPEVSSDPEPEVLADPKRGSMVMVFNNAQTGFTQLSTGLRIGGKSGAQLVYDGWVELNVEAGLFEIIEDA